MARVYSRSCFGRIFSSISSLQPLCTSTWRTLVQLGISRSLPTRRGCRAGCRKRRPISTIVTNTRAVRSILDFGREEEDISFGCANSLKIQPLNRANLNNCIVVHRTSFQKKHSPVQLLTLCSANVRSVKSKTADLLDYIYTTDVDLFALTETWLTDNDMAAKLEFIPTATHRFLQRNRRGHTGGGTGLLFKKNIVVKEIDAGEKNSFEFSEFNVNFRSLKMKLVIVYRPPYSEVHPVPTGVFIDEFGEYLESIILSPGSLIITGDFNIHMDVADDTDALAFTDLLVSMGLKQHVTGPTHTEGHTLDLLITRMHDTIISNVPVVDRYLSDHAAVLCQLNSGKLHLKEREISYRKIKSIDIESLRSDLECSDLCTVEFNDLNELSQLYHTTLASLFDKHAPLKKKVVVSRMRVPWFNSEIKDAIKVRRKAERKWRASKSQQDLMFFRQARNRATYIMNRARCQYYTDFITENSCNQKKLFRATKALLCEPNEVSFSDSIEPNQLANDFGEYFMQKISNITASLENNEILETPTDEVHFSRCNKAKLSNFKPLTCEEVHNLIATTARKSCVLDPMPTLVVLQVLDILLPVITNMINLSLVTGQFANGWKEALVLPILKKQGLDIAFKNFRPVSNLLYVSKLCEKAAVNQLTDHMTANGLHFPFQSAYKKYHSTESALLKVKNDILMNMNGQKVTLLILLDLSAAFDTICHKILLRRLKFSIGADGTVLDWLASYLTDRSQRIAVNGGLSSKFPLKTGVPQGSCLGPFLFTVYTSKLFQIVSNHLPSVHCYADDTQLYLSFSPNVPGDGEVAIESMRACIADIREWMTRDKLMLNDDKTEFILFGTRQQLAKVDINCIRVGSSDIKTSAVVRNLGSWFDSQLSMSNHINKICATSFFHLHNIRRIRKFLTPEATKALVHAFITSRVDYCNSLLYGLPAKQLHKLQRVLNASARLVCNASRYCHVSLLVRELHWLPVKFRIEYKLMLFVYKAINGLAPSYLCDLLKIKTSKYKLRSCDGSLLAIPSIRSKVTLGDRSFIMAAPKLWNALPKGLRCTQSIDMFKKHLKAHYFKLAYTS